MSQISILKILFEKYNKDDFKFYSVSEINNLVKPKLNIKAVRTSVRKLYDLGLIEFDFKKHMFAVFRGEVAIKKYRINRQNLKRVCAYLGVCPICQKSEVSRKSEKENTNIGKRKLEAETLTASKGVIYEPYP